MFGIALYNALRKIPEISDAKAKEVIADVASSKEVATKADIAEIKTAMAELKAEILKQQLGIAILIIAAVGLMIKFL